MVKSKQLPAGWVRESLCSHTVSCVDFVSPGLFSSYHCRLELEIGVERAAASEIILELEGFKGGKAIKRQGFR